MCQPVTFITPAECCKNKCELNDFLSHLGDINIF